MLPRPLQIDPKKFAEAYNLDVSDAIEDRQGSGGKSFSYLSAAHAIKFFRQLFPDLEVDCEVNPASGSYIFEEPGHRGFFIKPFVYGYVNGEFCKSASLYFSVLSMKMSTVYDYEVETTFDKNTRQSVAKSTLGVIRNVTETTSTNSKTTEAGSATKVLVAEDYSFEVDSIPTLLGNVQLYDKCVSRAKVKAIAFSTGLGLKLWTLEDLAEEVKLDKFDQIEYIEKVVKQLEKLGVSNPLPNLKLDYYSSNGEIAEAKNTLETLLSQEKQKLSAKKTNTETVKGK